MKRSRKQFFSIHSIYLLMCFVLLLNSYVSAQNHITNFPSNDLRFTENHFYKYNYQLYSYPNYSRFILDTFNYCRVKTNKIKAVEIYQFYSATDSLLIATINYDSLGMTANLKTKFSASDLQRVNCDSLLKPRYAPNKTSVKRTFHKKEIWVTDNRGYVVDYKRINKGIFNRWLMNNIGLPDVHISYQYDSLYQTVTETRCCSTRRHFRSCNAKVLVADSYVYHIDAQGNLIYEFEYKTNDQGVQIIRSGYTYHYTYY